MMKIWYEAFWKDAPEGQEPLAQRRNGAGLGLAIDALLGSGADYRHGWLGRWGHF